MPAQWEEENWRDRRLKGFKSLASSSRPGAIVILIRLFVISSPLIRPNSSCFHNASLSPFSFLYSRPLSSSLSLSLSLSLFFSLSHSLIKTMSDWRQSAQTSGVHTTSTDLRAKKITLCPGKWESLFIRFTGKCAFFRFGELIRNAKRLFSVVIECS